MRRIVPPLLAAVVLLGTVPVAAAGGLTTSEAPTAEETSFVVALEADGDATVTLRLTFDLDREAEQRALERLRENRTAIATEFREGLRAVAAGAAEETGREMRVPAADVSISTEGRTGVVELSATWVGLAAVEEDRLVVGQPFADGFEPPGRFEVRGPEGYVLASTTPTAPTTADAAASWAAGSSLDGFEAVFVPADAASDSSSQPLPGFGFAAGVLAIAVVAGSAGLIVRRRP